MQTHFYKIYKFLLSYQYYINTMLDGWSESIMLGAILQLTN